jgi:hypothetical protein
MKSTHAIAAFTPLILCILAQPYARGGDGKGDVALAPVPENGRPVTARIDRTGTVHLLYDSVDGPKYARSQDSGVTFGAPVPVVETARRPEGFEFSASDMAVGKDGRIHVAMSTNAWKLKLPTDEWAYHYASLDRDAHAFSPVRNINRKPSEGFSIAADGKGNVTACWLSDKLYANVSHDNGKTFAPCEEIDPAFNPCNCCTTAVEYAGDGTLAVLYREETNNERDMYLVLWDQHRGQTARTRISSTSWKIDECPMSHYAISRTPRGFLAVWPTRGEIYFARLDQNGHPLEPAEIKTPGRAGMRTGMLGLYRPDGSALVAWKKDGRLGWQAYDAAGRPSSKPGSAMSRGDGVAGVVSRDGRFLLFR